MTFVRDYLTGLVLGALLLVGLAAVLLLGAAETLGRAFWAAASEAYHQAR